MANYALELYNDLLMSIKRGNTKTGKSLAKPLFLLAVIDAVSLGQLKENVIKWDDEVLTSYYNALKRRYGDESNTSLSVPYYHLCSAPFWHLVWQTTKRPPITTHTPSSRYLRDNLDYACFDAELWELLLDSESRAQLREALVERYLR